MKRLKSLLPRQWGKTATFVSMALIVGLIMVPMTALAARMSPLSAGGLVGRVLHSGPKVGVLADETITPTVTSDVTVTPTVTETVQAGDETPTAEPTETQEPEDDNPPTDATATVTPTVEITPTVEVTPTVTGNSIVLRGPITALPAGSIDGLWTVAGQQVLVDASSKLSARAEMARVGDWAEILAEPQAAGQLHALRVTVMHENRLVRVVGLVQSFSDSAWVVGGVSVTVTSSTHIVGTPTVGKVADVHAHMGDANTVVADLIVVRGTPNQPKATVVPAHAPKPTRTPHAGKTQVEPTAVATPSGYGATMGGSTSGYTPARNKSQDQDRDRTQDNTHTSQSQGQGKDK